METTPDKLRYPIGVFSAPDRYSEDLREMYIRDIELFPGKLRAEVISLNKQQLDTTYRPGGWTIRQVVNHCADSHMNAFIRHKLALSNSTPTIMPYPEAIWAEMADAKNMAIEPALKTLEGLHTRWGVLLRSLTETEWQRSFVHPEKNRAISLQESAGSYAWHGRHHLAHITELKKNKNWG